MDLDVVLLSRIQFALTIMFHYLFPPLTIGMGIVLVYLEAMYLWTKEPIYETACKFWVKIFAVNFALGVASGIVMEFQFGTNWAVYSRFVGDVFGSALAAEGIFAFFLESAFLAVLVFGWDKVSPRFHFFGTVMVAVGSIFSSIWIVVANSWQQTPAGHEIRPVMRDGEPLVIDGVVQLRAEITDFWAVVFNPSFVDRILHVWIGCFIVGAFFIMSIAAYYMLKGRHVEFAHRSFTGALILATISSLAALVSGHMQAKTVYQTQPAKLAAFEGHFDTGRGDLSLIGWPDQENQQMRFNLALPGGLSFLIHEDFGEPVIGLDQFRIEDQPPIHIPYFSYRLMVAVGMAFIALTLLGAFLRWRGTLYRHRWLLWVFVFAIGPAMFANHAGWVSAEVGRQPWVVHPPVEWSEDGRSLIVNENRVYEYDETQGLRTSAAVSQTVSGGQVLSSIIIFTLIYTLLGVVWLFVLTDKIKHGPEPVHDLPEKTSLRSLLDTAAMRTGREGSLTEANEPLDEQLSRDE